MLFNLRFLLKMEGDENITQNIEVDAMCRPSTSTSVGNDDCRINCTDSQSLRSILDVTLDQISDLANSFNSNYHSELISRIGDNFKSALQENIVVNGLPHSLDKSTQLSSPEKKDQKQMVDEAFFSKLSKAVSSVAHKRKFCPDKCCQILKIQMKHDLQNLKKTKVADSSVSSTSSVTSSSKDRSHVKEKFSEFCKNINAVQEAVQYKVKEREKLTMKISLASDIKTQGSHLKSSADKD